MVEALVPEAPLPVAPAGPRAPGWYAMALVLATEGALFVYLLFSYFYLASQAPGHWPPSGAPKLGMAAINTGLLLLSSLTAWWGQRGIERGNPGRLSLGLLASLALGIVFTAVQLREWAGKSFTPATDAYGSLYFTITGIHIAHVVVGLIILACLLVWSLMGRFSASRSLHVGIGILYWHFVDAVWLAVFTTFYLTPHLGVG